MKRRNLITDIAGLQIGHAEDNDKATGVSVILPTSPMVCAVDIAGGAPGTAETDLLRPGNLVEKVDALVFAGGSAFGLSARHGAMQFLEESGRGFAVGRARIPIVPAAVIFDRPGPDYANYEKLGFVACEQAGTDFALGNVGAGRGARAGHLKGGVGSASAVFQSGDGKTHHLGAYVVVNSFGSVTIPGAGGCFWAWAFEEEAEFGGKSPPGKIDKKADSDDMESRLASLGEMAHTTIGVVATSLALDRSQALRVARMAHDGYGRAIRPVHTAFDGDAIFVLSEEKKEAGSATGRVEAGDVVRCGALAADCMARAIARGVYEASSEGDIPGWRDFYG